jgi:hypothetical protein
MKKGRFNRILSQLECVHGIAKPVPVTGDPVYISDFIHTVFESKEEFGLGGTNFTPEWFSEFSDINKTRAVKFVHNLLQENGHIVSQKTILEGIDKFNEGFENVK